MPLSAPRSQRGIRSEKGDEVAASHMSSLLGGYAARATLWLWTWTLMLKSVTSKTQYFLGDCLSSETSTDRHAHADLLLLELSANHRGFSLADLNAFVARDSFPRTVFFRSISMAFDNQPDPPQSY
ncbi:hypothetical protein KCU81_g574, partial [Aureobasidium melanogenum]